MGLTDYIEGETPLEEDEIKGLLISNISNKKELDEFEQKNIEEAVSFFMNKRNLKLDYFLSIKFIKYLHKRMFCNTWYWAGKFRNTEKNIGVDPKNITVEIKKLLDDCLYWINNNTFSKEEIAIRLKHRLVKIHPFNNGNGRHSRLLADLMMEKIFKQEPFSWGNENLYLDSNNRKLYLTALKKADNGYYDDLIAFALS